MAFDYNFDAGLGNYAVTFGNAAFDSTTGNPAAGCVKFVEEGGGGAVLVNTADSAAAGAGERIYFNYRVIGKVTEGTGAFEIITFTLTYADAAIIQRAVLYEDIAVGDSGWVQHSGDVLTFPTGHGNYDTLTINIGNAAFYGDSPTVYIDTISIGTVAPALSTGAGKFYQGVSVPTFKSNLPFAGIKPGAIAVSPNGQTVVLGANVAAGQMVIYAANPWASWSDMTPVMPTGTAVSSIKYV